MHVGVMPCPGKVLHKPVESWLRHTRAIPTEKCMVDISPIVRKEIWAFGESNAACLQAQHGVAW